MKKEKGKRSLQLDILKHLKIDCKKSYDTFWIPFLQFVSLIKYNSLNIKYVTIFNLMVHNTSIAI